MAPPRLDLNRFTTALRRFLRVPGECPDCSETPCAACQEVEWIYNDALPTIRIETARHQRIMLCVKELVDAVERAKGTPGRKVDAALTTLAAVYAEAGAEARGGG